MIRIGITRTKYLTLVGATTFVALFVIGLTLLIVSVSATGPVGPVARDLGLILLPGAIMVLVYELFLRARWVHLVKEAVEEETLSQAGSDNIFESFAASDIENSLSKASRTDISVMCTYMPQVVMEQSASRWKKLFMKALERDCVLRVLLLSPREMTQIQNRARQIPDMDPETFRRNILQNIEFFRELQKTYGDRVSMRVCNEYPLGPRIIIGKTLYQGFFLPRKDSLECPVVKANISNGGPFSELAESFQEIWQEADPRV